MLPISYRSSAPGSSLAACFCATSRMCLPASIAMSSALIDFGRPTNSGMTMCGNTTTSRSGSSGSAERSAGRFGSWDMASFRGGVLEGKWGRRAGLSSRPSD